MVVMKEVGGRAKGPTQFVEVGVNIAVVNRRLVLADRWCRGMRGVLLVIYCTQHVGCMRTEDHPELGRIVLGCLGLKKNKVCSGNPTYTRFLVFF